MRDDLRDTNYEIRDVKCEIRVARVAELVNRNSYLASRILPVDNPKYSAGHIPLANGRDLYINRGLGFMLQIRFNVRPEITIFHLQREE